MTADVRLFIAEIQDDRRLRQRIEGAILREPDARLKVFRSLRRASSSMVDICRY